MNEDAAQLVDDAWEPGGTLGNDERFVARADSETERAIDRALGFRIRLRRWLRQWQKKR